MTRQLTVLGSCGAYPEPGRASSGFLLEWDGWRAVLDLGYGTLPRLQTHAPAADSSHSPAIDAVIITHEHPDHCVDLHALFRIRYYGGGEHPKLPLYCPPAVLTGLAGLEPDVDMTDVFDLHPLPGTYAAGPFTLTGTLLPHHVPNTGIRLTADGTTIAYTGDTAPTPLLADLGRDADLYIIEATDRPGETERPIRSLMTASEAGTWAQAAGARRLMLTHFWPGNDRTAACATARTTFKGEVIAADEDLTIPFGRA